MAKNTATKARIFFVDYLRAAIITLVILHHIAITYAANTPFYYVESTTDGIAVLVLAIFELFNQAWFMGFFFLLSGYFSPSSFDRKGPKQFLKDRVIRLGIPLLIFSFLLNPLTLYIGFSHISAAVLKEAGITLHSTITWQTYLSAVGPGPLWFLIMLLIFDFGYAAWRTASRNSNARGARGCPFPTYRAIAVFILLFAATSYLIRIIVPMRPPVK